MKRGRTRARTSHHTVRTYARDLVVARRRAEHRARDERREVAPRRRRLDVVHQHSQHPARGFEQRRAFDRLRLPAAAATPRTRGGRALRVIPRVPRAPPRLEPEKIPPHRKRRARGREDDARARDDDDILQVMHRGRALDVTPVRLVERPLEDERGRVAHDAATRK